VGRKADEDAYGRAAQRLHPRSIIRRSTRHRELSGAAVETHRRRKLFPFTSLLSIAFVSRHPEHLALPLHFYIFNLRYSVLFAG